MSNTGGIGAYNAIWQLTLRVPRMQHCIR